MIEEYDPTWDYIFFWIYVLFFFGFCPWIMTKDYDKEVADARQKDQNKNTTIKITIN